MSLSDAIAPSLIRPLNSFGIRAISSKSNATANTVGQLPSYDFYVAHDLPTLVIVSAFEKHPELPGVLIFEDTQFMGVISRQKCFEWLSRPYGTEVFLKRPVLTLLKKLSFRPEVIPANTPIHQAVQLSLSRPPELRYEPILVSFPEQGLRLVDLHVLLLAQSEQLENANKLVRQQIEIGQALSSTLDPHKVLHLVLEHMANILPCDHCGILMLKDGLLEYAAQSGFSVRIHEEQQGYKLTESIVYQNIFLSRQPIILADLHEQPDAAQIERISGLRSWMGLPLIQSDQFLGILTLSSLAPNVYGAEELELAKTFASQAAIALQNAQSHEQMRLFNQELEHLVQERTADLQLAYAQLERMDKAKSDFIQIASHELRTPLTVIGGYLQMLQIYAEKICDARLHQYTEGIRSGFERVQNIVGNMIETARIEANDLHLNCTLLNLGALIEQVWSELANDAQQRQINFTIENLGYLPTVQGDADALKKVFYHLMVNAIKYTPNGGQVHISGQLRNANQNRLQRDAVEIIIRDTGIGIEPANHELIFTKFYKIGEVMLHSSGKTKFKGGGPGLGLSIVRGIVQAHGGQVWVESSHQDEEKLPGSQFHVLLPV